MHKYTVEEPDDEQDISVADRAQDIVHKLLELAQRLRNSRYGKPQLIFSNGSLVSTTDWDPSATESVRTLLQQGEQPLGFIAPPRDLGTPLARPWVRDDDKARAELCQIADDLFGHRLRPAPAQ